MSRWVSTDDTSRKAGSVENQEGPTYCLNLCPSNSHRRLYTSDDFDPALAHLLKMGKLPAKSPLGEGAVQNYLATVKDSYNGGGGGPESQWASDKIKRTRRHTRSLSTGDTPTTTYSTKSSGQHREHSQHNKNSSLLSSDFPSSASELPLVFFKTRLVKQKKLKFPPGALHRVIEKGAVHKNWRAESEPATLSSGTFSVLPALPTKIDRPVLRGVPPFAIRNDLKPTGASRSTKLVNALGGPGSFSFSHLKSRYQAPPTSALPLGTNESAPEDTTPQRAAQGAPPQRASQSAIPQRASQSAIPQRASQSAIPQRASQSAIPQRASQSAIPQRASQSAPPHNAPQKGSSLRTSEVHPMLGGRRMVTTVSGGGVPRSNSTAWSRPIPLKTAKPPIIPSKDSSLSIKHMADVLPSGPMGQTPLIRKRFSSPDGNLTRPLLPSISLQKSTRIPPIFRPPNSRILPAPNPPKPEFYYSASAISNCDRVPKSEPDGNLRTPPPSPLVHANVFPDFVFHNQVETPRDTPMEGRIIGLKENQKWNEKIAWTGQERRYSRPLPSSSQLRLPHEAGNGELDLLLSNFTSAPTPTECSVAGLQPEEVLVTLSTSETHGKRKTLRRPPAVAILTAPRVRPPLPESSGGKPTSNAPIPFNSVRPVIRLLDRGFQGFDTPTSSLGGGTSRTFNDLLGALNGMNSDAVQNILTQLPASSRSRIQSDRTNGLSDLEDMLADVYWVKTVDVAAEPKVAGEPQEEQAALIPVGDIPLPEAPLPEAPLPEAPLPEVPLPEAPLPEAPLPEVPLPEVPLPEVPLPEVPLPEVPLEEPPAPAWDLPGSDLPVPMLNLSSTASESSFVYEEEPQVGSIVTDLEALVVEEDDKKESLDLNARDSTESSLFVEEGVEQGNSDKDSSLVVDASEISRQSIPLHEGRVAPGHVIFLDADDTLIPTTEFCEQQFLDCQLEDLPEEFRRNLGLLDIQLATLFQELHSMIVSVEAPPGDPASTPSFLFSVLIVTNATLSHIQTTFRKFLPKLTYFFDSRDVKLHELVCSARDLWSDEFPFDYFYDFWKAWTLEEILRDLRQDGVEAVTVFSIGDDEPERRATAYVAAELAPFVKGTKILKLVPQSKLPVLISQLGYITSHIQRYVDCPESFDLKLEARRLTEAEGVKTAQRSQPGDSRYHSRYHSAVVPTENGDFLIEEVQQTEYPRIPDKVEALFTQFELKYALLCQTMRSMRKQDALKFLGDLSLIERKQSPEVHLFLDECRAFISLYFQQLGDSNWVPSSEPSNDGSASLFEPTTADNGRNVSVHGLKQMIEDNLLWSSTKGDSQLLLDDDGCADEKSESSFESGLLLDAIQHTVKFLLQYPNLIRTLPDIEGFPTLNKSYIITAVEIFLFAFDSPTPTTNSDSPPVIINADSFTKDADEKTSCGSTLATEVRNFSFRSD